MLIDIRHSNRTPFDQIHHAKACAIFGLHIIAPLSPAHRYNKHTTKQEKPHEPHSQTNYQH